MKWNNYIFGVYNFSRFFRARPKGKWQNFPPAKEFLSLPCFSCLLAQKMLNILSSFIFNYMAWHFFLCMQIAFLFISIIIVVALNNIYLRSVHTTPPGKNGDERAWKKKMFEWLSVRSKLRRYAHFTCCSVIFYSWARSNVKKLKFSGEVEKDMEKNCS